MKLLRVMESESEFTNQCIIIIIKENSKLYSTIANIIPA
jgi:hypothetical protein